MMIRNGMQDDIYNLGKYGCAFLSALRFFQFDIDDLSKAVAFCRNERIIDNEYTILSWERLFNALDQKKRHWKCRKVLAQDTSDDELRKADCVICEYKNDTTGLRHFVLLDKNLDIKYDGLYNSITVKNGYRYSYRVFYIVD